MVLYEPNGFAAERSAIAGLSNLINQLTTLPESFGQLRALGQLGPPRQIMIFFMLSSGHHSFSCTLSHQVVVAPFQFDVQGWTHHEKDEARWSVRELTPSEWLCRISAVLAQGLQSDIVCRLP